MKIGDVVKYNGIYGLCIEERPSNNFCLFCNSIDTAHPKHIVKTEVEDGKLIIQLPASPPYTLSLSDISDDVLVRLSYSSSIRKVTKEDERKEAIGIVESYIPQLFNILSKQTQRTLLML